MQFHAASVEATTDELDVDPLRGLSDSEAEERREQHGTNELQHHRRRSAAAILLDQFKSIVIIILAVAGVAALMTLQWVEAVAIGAVVLVNTLIGFFTEHKAARSMEALREMAGQAARVRRDGVDREVGVKELVPGDVILLEPGNLVPADARLVEGHKLRVNEAALTGESVAVSKTPEPVEEDAPLADRHCMLFKGTSISDGTATAVVTAIGMETELGNISQLAEEAESGSTPLQQRLDQLGRYLAYITIGIAVVVALSGLAAGRETMLMIETSIALGVAAIPEGLPIVATIALARGMWLMAQRNALVNRLTAVETLGATRVIFTDKTGTLTENRMTLNRIQTSAGQIALDEEKESGPRDSQEDPGHELMQRALRIGVLCNGASLGQSEDEQATGDPTEIALLAAGRRANTKREELLEELPVERVVEFDSDTMMMATFHKQDEGDIYVAVKGAPAATFDKCRAVLDQTGQSQPFDDAKRSEWDRRVEELASQGLRLLAVADKVVEQSDAEPYQDLTLVGLVGLLDPPRREVKEAINRCQAAGIRVLMVTGDQPTTGRAIGRAVGIGDEEDAPALHGRDLPSPEEMEDELQSRVHEAVVFARVSPEQKLNLVEFYQQRGEPVAMTGDGVNDAPALKKADIGVAMGQRGTDAAKQTADMILQDDSFETIVAAVEQGRVIFGNIRKSVVFMLCTNVAEILAVTIASLTGLPIPLKPLQILYLNVVTDVFPALALGIGEGRGQVMNHPPRDPEEPVLTRHLWTAIVSWSVVIAACVMSALLIAGSLLGYDAGQAITVSFLTLALGKLWFVFNLRDHDAPRWRNEITQNQWLWGAILLCILLVAAAVYLPGLSDVLQTVAPVGVGWLVVLGLSALPAVVGLFVPGIRFHADTNRQSTPAAVEDSEDRLAKLENKVDENRESVEVLRRQIDSAETNEGKRADQSETRDGSPKSDGAAPSK